MAAICKCLDECDCKAALQAQEPYITVEDKPDPCCCAKNPMGKSYEPFDCHAGDPHQYPTVAAFKHAHDFVNKKKERIAKRKSIYDEIVQYGTEEEIQEARVSLYKQIMEDGTKEEQEEARKTLTQEEEIEEDECDCPEIQEIVVMIEDSDCEVDPMYNNCQYQDQYNAEREMWLQNEMPEYPKLQENWEPAKAFEPVENNTLETQSPREKSPKEVKRTSETQTPKTLGTQTVNSLQTQTSSMEKLKTSKTSIKEKTAQPETKDGKEKKKHTEKLASISQAKNSFVRKNNEVLEKNKVNLSKNERSVSISKSDNKDEEIQKTDKNKRSSRDVEKNKTERAGSFLKSDKKDEEIQKADQNKSLHSKENEEHTQSNIIADSYRKNSFVKRCLCFLKRPKQKNNRGPQEDKCGCKSNPTEVNSQCCCEKKDVLPENEPDKNEDCCCSRNTDQTLSSNERPSEIKRQTKSEYELIKENTIDNNEKRRNKSQIVVPPIPSNGQCFCDPECIEIHVGESNTKIMIITKQN